MAITVDRQQLANAIEALWFQCWKIHDMGKVGNEDGVRKLSKELGVMLQNQPPCVMELIRESDQAKAVGVRF